jgi:hypothetical protein
MEFENPINAPEDPPRESELAAADLAATTTESPRAAGGSTSPSSSSSPLKSLKPSREVELGATASTFDVDHRGGVSVDPFASIDPAAQLVSIEQAISIFQDCDQDQTGTLLRAQVGMLLRKLNRETNDDDAIDDVLQEVWEAGGQVGNIEELPLQGFVSWWAVHAADEIEPDESTSEEEDDAFAQLTSNAFVKPLVKLTKPLVGLLKKGAHAAEKGAGMAQMAKVRGIAPESVFVIDQSGNTDAREKSEIRVSIQEAFESELHHLEDVLYTCDEDSHMRSIWDRIALKNWDDVAPLSQLDWQPEFLAAARKEIESMPGAPIAVYRTFVRLTIAQKQEKDKRDEKMLQQQQSGGKFSKFSAGLSSQLAGLRDEKQLTAAVCRDMAHEYVVTLLGDGPRKLEILLDEDTLPLDVAVDGVLETIDQEIKLRTRKIAALNARLRTAVGDTPRKVQISGLRGEAAVANGLYIADGLRNFWGRPLYVQVPASPSQQLSSLHYLYYDCRHDGSSLRQWTDGCWVIGPDLNSERCTAYVLDKADDMYFPLPTASTSTQTKGTKWMVYDTITQRWAGAPGNHCAGFLVKGVIENETMPDYIAKSIQDQQHILDSFQAAIDSADATMGAGERDGDSPVNESFRDLVELKLSIEAKDGQLERKHFIAWRTNFYQKQIATVHGRIRRAILSPGKIQFHSNDRNENKELVDELIEEFIGDAQAKAKGRRVAKRKFLARVNRPILSRVFLSWKFSVRKADDSAAASSGMFTEPPLPWNVRHPNGTFTNIWEGIQAFLLIYVAFSIVWRMCFNVEASGGYYLWELGIDIYFSIDVILNFHTAYYNDSGDLVGVKSSGGGSGKPDYLALYSHYAQGWMIIDVVSVLPFEFIMEQTNTGDPETGGHLKTLKALRLFRLLKLLRLVRALRIFKKYEDSLGPMLSGIIIIGSVVLLIHYMTCIWYFTGTQEGLSKVEGFASTGWVEFMYQGTASHCSCYSSGNSTLAYDTLERRCFNATDDTAKLREPCSENIPSPWDYYSQSMFSAMQNTGIHPDYIMSLAEMMLATVLTSTLGFMWGAVAGAWGAIFAQGQMASQTYKMKLRTVREFCKIKQLDWGVRAKLVAHYEHLYPEQVIVDEREIINELPERMRDELVRQMYGHIILTVPLFYGLQNAVLTELCLLMNITSALKGQVLTREGTLGRSMYIIESGTCRVTQHLHIGDDTERARRWITEVFATNNKIITLYAPNEKQLLEKLMKAIKKVARRKKRAADAVEAQRSMKETRDAMQAASRDSAQYDSQDAEMSTLDQLFDQLLEHQANVEEEEETDERLSVTDIEWLLARLSKEFVALDADEVLQEMDTSGDGLADRSEFAEWWKLRKARGAKDSEDAASALRRIQAGAVYYRDLVDDEEIEALMSELGTTLSSLLVKAKKRRLISFSGPLTLFVTPDDDDVPDWHAKFGSSKLGSMGSKFAGMGSAGLSQGLGKFNKLRKELRGQDLGGLEPSDGPEITINRRGRHLSGETTTELLCGALRNGALLCELLNYFLPARERVAVWKPSLLDTVVAESMALAGELADAAMDVAGEVAGEMGNLADKAAAAAEANAVKYGGDKAAKAIADSKAKLEQAKEKSGMNAVMGEASGLAASGNANALAGAALGGATDAMTDMMQLGGGPKANIRAFCEVLLDPNSAVRMEAEHVLTIDDLLTFDSGSQEEQEEKQQRVLTCILELGYSVSTGEGYMGPLLDEVQLGSLSNSQFFGELCLLPFKVGCLLVSVVVSLRYKA